MTRRFGPFRHFRRRTLNREPKSQKPRSSIMKIKDIELVPVECKLDVTRWRY